VPRHWCGSSRSCVGFLLSSLTCVTLRSLALDGLRACGLPGCRQHPPPYSHWHLKNGRVMVCSTPRRDEISAIGQAITPAIVGSAHRRCA
jgi:hypothetical protein